MATKRKGEPTKVIVRDCDEVRLLKICGELDFSNCQLIKNQLNSSVKGCKYVVFDLSELEFLDVEGVRLIWSFTQSPEKIERKAVIMGCNRCVERIFQMTGFDDNISILPDMESAVNFVRQSL